jgi:uncharacterized protein (DUF488 family)
MSRAGRHIPAERLNIMNTERTIYTAGYSGHTPEELAKRAEALGAVVCDIRFKPVSRRPEWNRSRLASLLGTRYVWLQAFGNVNYKSDGPIELLNAPKGLMAIESLPGPVILLCFCKEAEGCHRSEVARLLHEQGIKTQELVW